VPHGAKRAKDLNAAARKANVFYVLLALYGELPCDPPSPWNDLLAALVPVHLSKISYYWATVIALARARGDAPRARNPRNVRIAELFVSAPTIAPAARRIRAGPGPRSRLLDRTPAHRSALPKRSQRAMKPASLYLLRLNGEDGLAPSIRRWRTAMMYDASIPRHTSNARPQIGGQSSHQGTAVCWALRVAD
jgi:hypothetical protein